MRFIKIKKIPTLIGLLTLVSSLILGVILINKEQVFRLQAKDETSPKNVRVSNISSSNFSISWTTDLETKGFVKWGEKEKSLNSVALDKLDPNTKVKNHYLNIDNLESNKNYYFIINSEGLDYNSNGLSWQVQTGENLSPPANSNIIYGSILNLSGEPERKAIIYVSAGGGSLLSTTSQEDGSWVIPLSLTRSKDLKSYVPINEYTTVIEISALSGSLVSAATIYPIAAKPVPPITLGQTYDFKNLTEEGPINIPTASLEIPQQDILVTSTPAVGKSVIIENPKEGESIAAPSLEFSGLGPPEKSITITVESDNKITDSTKTDSGGNWTWVPSQNLPPGEHTLTVSWVDDKGIINNVKRDFVIQAQEIPTLIPTQSEVPLQTQPTAVPTTTTTNPISSIFATNGILLFIPIPLIILGVILMVFIKRRRKHDSPIASQSNNVNVNTTNEPPKNSVFSAGAKAFLFIGGVIFVAAGAYSLYQLYISKNTGKETTNKIAQITPAYPSQPPTPTLIPLPSEAEISPNQTTSTETTINNQVTPTPTTKPTPTPLPTLSPTTSQASPTPTLTQTPTPTIKITPTPTLVSSQRTSGPTVSPLARNQLPVAGFSFPTIVIFIVAFILLMFSLVIAL